MFKYNFNQKLLNNCFVISNINFFNNKNSLLIKTNLIDSYSLVNSSYYRLDKFYKKNYISSYFKKNGYYFYLYNSFNIDLLKNFIKIIDKICINNQNVIFIDNDYKSILPLYNYIYGTKNVLANKQFFLIEKNYLTLNNWLYFFNKFLNKFKVKSLFFLDYNNFSKFFKSFLRFNLPIISIVPNNLNSCYIDYFFYINKHSLEINKLLFFNLTTMLLMSNINFLNYNFKLKFFKNYSFLFKFNNK